MMTVEPVTPHCTQVTRPVAKDEVILSVPLGGSGCCAWALMPGVIAVHLYTVLFSFYFTVEPHCLRFGRRKYVFNRSGQLAKLLFWQSIFAIFFVLGTI
jgi:hypothetical protein